MNELTLKLKLTSSSIESGLATSKSMSANLPCIHTQTDKITFLKSELASTVLHGTVCKTAIIKLMDSKLDLVISTLYFIVTQPFI